MSRITSVRLNIKRQCSQKTFLKFLNFEIITNKPRENGKEEKEDREWKNEEMRDDEKIKEGTWDHRII